MKNNVITNVTVTSIIVGFILLMSLIVINAGQSVEKITASVENGTNNLDIQKQNVETKLIGTHTVEYVQEEITEIEYLDRITYIERDIRNYHDLNELEQWLLLYAETKTLRFHLPETQIDCDDYASELQRAALADGYLVSFQIIRTESYNSLFENSSLPDDTLHAINLVIIDNAAYYIEPQTGETVMAAYID